MSFHQYKVSELYSNPSGTLQFIELTVGGFNGESFWAGVSISTTRNGVTHSFTFPTNLPSTATANTSVLIATQAFADAAGVTPNYIVPDGFLFTAGGSLDFGGADLIDYAALPGDIGRSLNRTGTAVDATPKNFAGVTGSISVADTVSGGSGDDDLTGTAKSELVDGRGGIDTLHSGGGNDILHGGSGDDKIYSGAGNDAIDGGDGYDYLYYDDAGAGVTINMTTGTASGGAGSDTFTSVELLFGSAFDDHFVGNDQGVNFLGMGGNDTITGGAGRDRLEGNGGDDVIDGLGDVDGVAYYSAAFAVDVNLGAGTATGGLGTDILRNIEEAIGSVFGDRLTGSAADNRLEGSEGNDTLVSTAGDDQLVGDEGLDSVVYSLARSAYTLHRTTDGEFSIEKPDAAGSDVLTTIERLQFSDVGLALDLDGHAGQTARLLGAVFGTWALAVPEFVGIGLSALDSGISYEQLATAAMAVTGKNSAFDVVSLLWANQFGSAPTAEQAAPVVALLDGGMTVGALTVAVAELDLNASHIDLVGLVQSGIEFVG